MGRCPMPRGIKLSLGRIENYVDCFQKQCNLCLGHQSPGKTKVTFPAAMGQAPPPHQPVDGRYCHQDLLGVSMNEQPSPA